MTKESHGEIWIHGSDFSIEILNPRICFLGVIPEPKFIKEIIYLKRFRIYRETCESLISFFKYDYTWNFYFGGGGGVQESFSFLYPLPLQGGAEGSTGKNNRFQRWYHFRTSFSFTILMSGLWFLMIIYSFLFSSCSFLLFPWYMRPFLSLDLLFSLLLKSSLSFSDSASLQTGFSSLFSIWWYFIFPY